MKYLIPIILFAAVQLYSADEDSTNVPTEQVEVQMPQQEVMDTTETDSEAEEDLAEETKSIPVMKTIGWTLAAIFIFIIPAVAVIKYR